MEKTTTPLPPAPVAPAPEPPLTPVVVAPVHQPLSASHAALAAAAIMQAAKYKLHPKERKSFRDEVERLRDGQGKAMERMNGYQRELGRILRAFKEASGAVLDDKYLGDQHQDINEFMMQLLEYTHTQFRKFKVFSHLESLYLRDCMEWNKYINANNSPVVTSFDGFLRRTRVCPKGHSTTNFDIFRTLTLHFDVRLDASFPFYYVNMISDVLIRARTLSRNNAGGG
jgi:hypothetical protein